MRNFTKEEVATKRSDMESRGWEKIAMEFGGHTFDCYLIPAELCPPDLPNAVMRVTPALEEFQASANPGSEAFFAVAASVPEKFRRFVVFHEYVEFLEIGLKTPNRCARAAHREIQFALADDSLSDQDKREYLDMRTGFFLDLVKYARAHAADYSLADIREFQGAWRAFKNTGRPL